MIANLENDFEIVEGEKVPKSPGFYQRRALTMEIKQGTLLHTVYVKEGHLRDESADQESGNLANRREAMMKKIGNY